VVPWGTEGAAAVDLGSGDRLWLASLPKGPMSFAINRHSSSSPVSTPYWGKMGVYVAGVDGVVRQLDHTSGETKAEAPVGVPFASDLVIKGAALFVADYGGTVYRYSVR